MKVISFAWTTEAVLAGQKTCTRRDWVTRYALSFKQGELVQAWDKLPRAGGKRVGTIRLTEAPINSNQYPEADYWNEGLGWMMQQDIPLNGSAAWNLWQQWETEKPWLWVVRFEFLEAQ